MLVFFWVALGCWIMFVLLLLHHTYSHPELPYPDRIFQVSDVCKFDSWNHEMWIILFLVVGVICTIAFFITNYA
jgi:hypothetical protein